MERLFVNRYERIIDGIFSPAADDSRATSGGLDPFNDSRCRDIRNERDGFHHSAASFNQVAADDLVQGPIPAFHENIRLKVRDESLRIGLIEQHDIVHACQRRQDLCPLSFRDNGPSRSLAQPPHGSVRIHTDHEKIAQVPGGLKIARMPDVHEIETPIGEHNAPALRTVLFENGYQIGSISDFHVLGHATSYRVSSEES